MGSSVFVVLDRDLSELDVFMDGDALAKAERSIGKLCRKLDVRDLWSFYSDGAEEDTDEEDDDGYLRDDAGGYWDGEDGDASEDDDDDFSLDLDDDVEAEAEEWFSPGEGLLTVRTLIEHIEEEDGAGLRDADGVLEDLRAMERLLETAEAEGARWHLGVDF